MRPLLGWMAFITGVVSACAPLPLGSRIPAEESGLVGEWAAVDQVHPGDTLLWRFGANGRYDLTRVEAGLAPRHLARGRWQTNESSSGDHRRLVCFNYRPGRGWPSCRVFAVYPFSESGHHGLHLTWTGWVGEKEITYTTLEKRVPR